MTDNPTDDVTGHGRNSPVQPEDDAEANSARAVHDQVHDVVGHGARATHLDGDGDHDTEGHAVRAKV